MPATGSRPTERKPGRARGGGGRSVARICTIRAGFPRYGYRRVTAQLKAEGCSATIILVGRAARAQSHREPA
jgi:hypothetical protein